LVAEHDDEARARALEAAASFQRAYADALLRGVPREAEAIVREAIEAGLDEGIIHDHVVAPALRLVGDLWADGEISIAQEHLATSISLRVLTLQREAFRVARERAARRVLLAGAEGEHHIVGLMMASSLLLHAGYDVRLYGADLPVPQLAGAVASVRPSVVGLTTATALTAMNVPRALEAVRLIDPEVALLVGGRGVDEAWASAFDVVVCRHVGDSVDHVDALVQRAGRN
jgi:MerR family transcriptional regulator, light-induced transcriptional regulator